MVKKIYGCVILIYTLSFLLLAASCNKDDEGLVRIEPPESLDLSQSFYYYIDLNNRSDDKFKVSLFVDGLTDSNRIFQMPVTVPGTYDILDFGRFMTDFKVYDENYNRLNVTKISSNQWDIESPESAYRIEYEILETWDTPVQEHQIFPMAGTSLENSHVLLNTFGVLGYQTGLKERDYYLKLDYPDEWSVGTSLEKTNEGYYWAKDYDYLVDSPILLGVISNSSFEVDNADINIYTYSEMGLIQSSDMTNDLKQVIEDASSFLGTLPVDRYNFLYMFEGPRSFGALEHSYSSVYVMADFPYSEYGNLIKGFSAHEFFHVVVPLNIHSEIIENFNFADPVPSEHLWLYEGVTEWASDMMQYRNGSMEISELFGEFSIKISNDKNNYDPNYSLSEISLESYTEEGGKQFGNIYNRGSMTATLFDIRLLELSDGEMGLRDLILELIDTYGPENAFPETQFFDIVVDMTFPEMEDFINHYIQGADPLPYQEYFDNIGITYDPINNEFSKNSELTDSQQLLFNNWRNNF